MKALVVILLLLAGLAVGADRVALVVAEHRVGQEVARQGGLAEPPGVHIAGFPFLTQVVTGDYPDVRVSLTAAELGRSGARADVSLRGVHAPLSALLSGSGGALTVDRVRGTATVPYALLAAAIGPDTTLTREGDHLRVTRTVQLLGRPVRLSAAGRVTLSGDDLLIDVQDAAAEGVALPRRLVAEASDQLGLRYRVPALPFGLRLTAVRPGPDGVALDIRADDAVLRG